MKAIIMAGGEGTRLRPLTCDCPKPMLRLLDRPFMEYAIALLKKHGIDEIGVTLAYLPEEIQDYFGDGSRFGVRLHYYIERLPLGTAGSIGAARDFLDERFLVLSGDGVTDFDLSGALRFHAKNDAEATLILHRCPDPREYGMVVTDGEGRIRAFHEKPGRSEVISDRINTGMYILEPEILRRIPENRPCDFGSELFPAMLAEGAPLYGFTAEGYWCDVGDAAALLRVHRDALEGRIQLSFPSQISGEAVLEPGCRIEAPCYIGPGAQICSGAQVGPGTAIGPGCILHPGCSVRRSLLMRGVRVEAGARLRGCIVCNDALIGENAQLFEESVVGKASSVGRRALIGPGVKLWPGKMIPDGDRPEANVVWGSRREQRFVDGMLRLEDPRQASRAAETLCAALQPGELLIGHSGSAVAEAILHAVCAGAMAQGVQVLEAGAASLPQLRHALARLRCGCALLVTEQGLLPLTPDGARISEKQQRAILKLGERQDYPAPFAGLTRAPVAVGRTDLSYVSSLAAAFRADPALAPAIILCCEDGHILRLGEAAFRRAGLDVRCEWDARKLQPEAGELAFCLTPDGSGARPADLHGPLDEIQHQLARAWTLLEDGARRLILPLHATRAIEALAAEYGAQAVYPPGEATAWMRAAAEQEPRQLELQCDGLCFAISFLSRLTEKGLSLDQWRMGLPSVYRSARMLRLAPDERGRALRTLADAHPDAEPGGGLRLPGEEGWAWLCPSEAGSELALFAEAASMEAAEGMCDFFERELRQLLAVQD